MKMMLRGFATLAVALAAFQATGNRAEAARFSKLLNAHATGIHANALTPRQEYFFKARIVFQQYRSLAIAARIEAIQNTRFLLLELRQHLISRQEFFAGRQSIISAYVTNAIVLRNRLSISLTAIRNDPFGAPATLLR